MATMQRFIRDNTIAMTAERWRKNPNMDSRDMDHWKVVFRNGSRRLTTYFSMGYGHNGKEPTAADVLDCLASDASSVDNSCDFNDWASDFGYDPDSRKAERTFRLIERQSLKLHRFLGDEAYRALLNDVERL
jgi:hypothetical protein